MTKKLFSTLSLMACIGSAAAQDKAAPHIPADSFIVPEGFEVSVWATSPMFYNPTNMDVDYKGRIWVAEGRGYRVFRNKFNKKEAEAGDRIMVLADTDNDGKADKSHVFVQDKELIAPLGVAVIDNKVIVSQPPNLIIYHDVDGNAVFDPKVDKKENFLTGFGGQDHDHSLHAVTAGPSGQWYFNVGNAGTHIVKDKDGFTVRVGSSYKGGSPSVTKKGPNQGGKPGLESDDGHTYVGSAILRINPDGTGMRVVAHNMRNSYEETITSFGDVFQNDNDDPPACRVTWVMEYGNLGFSSDDGARKWIIDRRPGQSAAIAEWRQEDPGKIPAGDVYGNGSPTGITFYENGALGDDWSGLLLSAEAARNVIFGYFPKPSGAGYALERFDFFKSNPEAPVKDGVSPNDFRPSDVTVGADGAIYVADWFDSGVGGHKTADREFAGAIYRIVPKGKNPTTPQIDLSTTEGQIAALKSPAINTRNQGFTRLKAKGEAALPAVKALLQEESDYLKARAIWLMSQLGDAGIKEVEKILQTSDNTNLRVTAFRALRLADHKVLELVAMLADDPSIVLRREAALALRDVKWAEAKESLYKIATKYDGNDRWYLEAVGTGATGKEAELYDALISGFDKSESHKWGKPMARLAWRLHPDHAVEALKARALDSTIDIVLRKEMLTALGFIPTKEACLAMVEIAEKSNGAQKSLAQWWLASLSTSSWKEYKGEMKGLDVKPNVIKKVTQDYKVAMLAAPAVTKPTVEEVLKLKGDPEKGKITISRCYMCHQVNNAGVEFGPNLTQWGIGRSVEAIATAIINPNDAIAHGYEASVVTTKTGHTIEGLSQGTNLQQVFRVFGGQEIYLTNRAIRSNKVIETSLMPSAGQMALQNQDVADIAAYLRALGQDGDAVSE